jgi:hypothetical protein
MKYFMQTLIKVAFSGIIILTYRHGNREETFVQGFIKTESLQRRFELFGERRDT